METNDKNIIEAEGEVLEACKGATFKVRVDNDLNKDMVILCHVSGKIRKNFINILAGDRVQVEISPYDLTKGRITYRKK